MADPVSDCLVALVIPGRRQVGALATAMRRHGLQYVEGWPTEPFRARYAGRPVLCLVLAGFEVTPSGRGRLTLPAEVADALYEVPADVGGEVEIALLQGGDDAPRTARLDVDALRGPLQPGCRYVLAPPPPRTGPLPGRPETEGWTR